jgi:AmmeMemoRadiSam system protein A
MSPRPELTVEEQRQLLRLAREAVAAVVCGSPAPVPQVEGRLAEPGAAFVTLKRDGDLRGCIGCIEPRAAGLAATVVRMATAAAREDSRFPPVKLCELGALALEISVLGPLVDISGPGDVVIGRDGLVVEQQGRRGLLLPQVAPEWGWDAPTLVRQVCRKAGLQPDAWAGGARLSRFEALVFSEETVP